MVWRILDCHQIVPVSVITSRPAEPDSSRRADRPSAVSGREKRWRFHRLGFLQGRTDPGRAVSCRTDGAL